VKGYLLKTVVEDTYNAAVEANPYLAAKVLRWNGVIRPGHLHMAVTMDLVPALVVEGEWLRRER